MKILILLLLSIGVKGQFFYFMPMDKSIPWNAKKYYTLCGLDSFCTQNKAHYRLLGSKEVDPDGVCIYGPQQSLIGFLTKSGFVAIRRRDHLIGKPQDRELLEKPEKMFNYLKTINL